VVDLRIEACDDEAVLRRHGLDVLHLPTIDHDAVSPAMLDDGVAFAADQLAAGRRLLIHCEHGVGRSALLALCVLADRGMTAAGRARTRQEPPLAGVRPTRRQYEAWQAWLAARGLEPPGFDAFAEIAYRHLR
jgi:protein-tyrosine phosphatase